MILRGIPEAGTPSDVANNLNVSVKYFLPNGRTFLPQSIPQGTDFIAEVTVSNPGMKGHYSELALTQIFPSGWEILNWRMGVSETNNQYFRYQDIRDDRVYSFFDLGYNGKSIEIPLVATYAGRFFMPQQFAESMYDNTIYAKEPGKWIEVHRE